MPILIKQIFTFPHPVNEYAARAVALQVLILTIIIIATEFWPLLFLMLYEFLARVLSGPTLSIMGQLSTRLIVPLLIKKERIVPGPPKRFAQIIGLVFTITIILLIYWGDFYLTGKVVLAVLGIFAALESLLGFCAGCWAFSLLMRVGLIPEEVCERCNNLRPSLTTEDLSYVRQVKSKKLRNLLRKRNS
tara:strand:- start:60 stop:629 length:570 start_codon:yes stop_codon:yes gene_type:complete